MFSVHLHILPICLKQHWVGQKCLMPKNHFPESIYPGKWAKCYMHRMVNDAYDARKNTKDIAGLVDSDSLYTICQVFPLDDNVGEDICLIDYSVSSSEQPLINFGDYILNGIEYFDEEIAAEIPRLNVNLQLKRQHCIDNRKILNMDYLASISHLLLQNYHFTHDNYVRSIEMEAFGIKSIHVEINEVDVSGLVSIGYTTDVIIENIRIWQRIPVNRLLSKTMFIPTINRIQQHLSDALLAVHIQRNFSGTQCLPFCLLLIGPRGSGKTTMINEFLYKNKCNPFYINYDELMIKTEIVEAESYLRCIFDAAIKFEMDMQPCNPVVIVMDDLHLLCPHITYEADNQTSYSSDMETIRLIMQLASLLDHIHKTFVPIMCLASTSNPEAVHPLLLRSGRFVKQTLLTPLTSNDRKLLFRKLFSKQFPRFQLPTKLSNDVVKSTANYNLSDLALLVRNMVKIRFKKSKELPAAVEKALYRIRPQYLRGMGAVAYRTIEDFSFIAGMTNLKRMLEQTVLRSIRSRSADLRLGLRLPKGILLYGPPGCCKTILAKCLATEANMNFISTTGADFHAPFLGKTAKFLLKIFDMARRSAPCVIFLDELDGLLGRRCFKSPALQIRILSTLLSEMDAIQNNNYTHDPNAYILVVAATRYPDMIDTALLRPGRFDKLIHVTAPDVSSRRSILDMVATRLPIANDIDLNAIAESLENCSNADIFNICNEAALLAYQRDPDNIEIQSNDFKQILEKTKPSLTYEQIHWYDQFEQQFQQ